MIPHECGKRCRRSTPCVFYPFKFAYSFFSLFSFIDSSSVGLAFSCPDGHAACVTDVPLYLAVGSAMHLVFEPDWSSFNFETRLKSFRCTDDRHFTAGYFTLFYLLSLVHRLVHLMLFILFFHSCTVINF